MKDKKNFGFGTQIRKSPYFNSTVKWGATGFSVYNHMYIQETLVVQNKTSGI